MKSSKSRGIVGIAYGPVVRIDDGGYSSIGVIGGEKLPPPKRKQIVQILDAFLGSEKVKKER